MPTPPDVRAIREPPRGVPDEPRPPATNTSSPTARWSSWPAASSSTTAHQPSRITRPQQSDTGVQTPFDLRCVRASVTTGFHDDHTPSLHVYDEPERGWYCFGCGRGGSIFDLAAILWHRETRGSDFQEVRRALAALVQ
jgi:CHC2 zinc finger